METKYRIRKVVFMLAFICLLLVGLNVARAEYIDLKGADVIGQTRCTKDNKIFICVVVEFKDVKYLVLIDRKGEYEIYLVGEKETTLIWSRDSI